MARRLQMIHVPKESRRRPAFTLVELLVVLTLSSVIILAGVAASKSGWLLWRRVENRRPADQMAEQIIQMMRSEWGGLYWPMQPGGGSPFAHSQSGTGGERKISFCTVMPSYYRGLEPGRCVRLTYEYRVDASLETAGGVLIRREQMMAGELPISEPRSDVVADGLNSFVMEFYDKSGKPYEALGKAAAAPPRRVKLAMSWPVPDASGDERESRVYMAEFMVPAEAALLPEDADEHAES